MSDKKKDLEDIARNVWLFGLGTVASIEEEATRLASQIKEKSEEQARKTVDDVVHKAAQVQQEIQIKVDTAVEEVVNHIGLPSQKQVQKLSSRIDDLTKKIEALTKKSTASK